jgi:histidyl-tRNA synthetase
MSKIKPSLPKGTRDFGPAALRKRQYIFNIIKNVFEKYGFEPIETPAMENLSVLEGKYGEEGDKLLFRILNSGDPFQKFRNKEGVVSFRELRTSDLCEKGLRYDLTIPFARYVVMHQSQIVFPFRRYQIQPVWRADRPQKGRYREFYQCDADIIGTDSLLNEVELVLMYDEVFKKLGIAATIFFNNRKILSGFAQVLGIEHQLTTFTILLDKLDKTSKEAISNEFRELQFPEKAVEILDYANNRSNDEQIKFLKRFLSGNETGTKGIEEVEFILNHTPATLNITLARGLDYYTGTIFEAKAQHLQMGSIGGGGRYDNLTGVFGLDGVSGVGISFGIERIFDIMEESGLLKHLDATPAITKVLFVNFGKENETRAFEYTNKIRQQNIAAEIYPSPVKIDKQMKYANARKIPYVAFVGETELKNNTLQLKNMLTGQQFQCSIEEAIEILK